MHLQLLKQKLQHNKISEALLVQVFQTEQDEARRLASYEIQNDSFQTSISLNQKLYEALVRRLNEVGLIRNVGGYQIDMIEAPSLGKRVAPSMILTLLIGAVLGTGLGLGGAYWTDYRDTRFRSKNEIARTLGLNVLGAIPRQRALAKNPLATGGAVASEAFWKLRNTLCLHAEKSGPKVIQVASPTGREGTTTVAANLSATLAQSGKKVLLIDVNLAEQPVHDSGLARLSLAAMATAAATFQGPPLPRFASRFDFIIIDSPAILATADASAILRTADAALLTIDFTRTTRPHAERAAQLLASSGVKILGVVVNAAAKE